jgi:hypothetical protein
MRMIQLERQIVFIDRYPQVQHSILMLADRGVPVYGFSMWVVVEFRAIECEI